MKKMTKHRILPLAFAALVTAGTPAPAEANPFSELFQGIRRIFGAGGDEVAEEVAQRGARNLVRLGGDVGLNIPGSSINWEESYTFIEDMSTRAFRGEYDHLIQNPRAEEALVTELTFGNRPHAILSGPSGSGKSSLIENLALQSLSQDGKVVRRMDTLAHNRFLRVNLSRHVNDQMLKNFTDALTAAPNNENIVVVFTDLHRWTPSPGNPNAAPFDLGYHLEEIASRTRAKVLVETASGNEDVVVKYLSNFGLERIVRLPELKFPDDLAQIVRISEGHAQRIARQYSLSVSDQAIIDAIRVARYFGKDLPGGLVEVLERAAHRARRNIQSGAERIIREGEMALENTQTELRLLRNKVGPQFDVKISALERKKSALEAKLSQMPAMEEELIKTRNEVDDLIARRESLLASIDNASSDDEIVRLRTELGQLDKELESAQFRHETVAKNFNFDSIEGVSPSEAIGEINLDTLVRANAPASANLDLIRAEVAQDVAEFTQYLSRVQEDIVGQEAALKRIIDHLTVAMNREPGTRRGAFLAAGASQTGKTETFKALAKRLGVEILIVPCGNLKHGEDVSFLVGSTPGHIGSDAGGKLTNFLRDNPNGIVVFDEIEKADPEILDALLTPLAGKPVKFMSGTGEEITGDNAIFGFTTNLLWGNDPALRRAMDLPEGHAHKIYPSDLERLQNSRNPQEAHNLMRNLIENINVANGSPIIRAEMMNRVDGLLYYNAFSDDEIYHLMTRITRGSVTQGLNQPNIGLVVQDNVLELLSRTVVSDGLDANRNASRVLSVIRNHLEASLAQLKQIQLTDFPLKTRDGDIHAILGEGDIVGVSLREEVADDVLARMNPSEIQSLLEYRVYTYRYAKDPTMHVLNWNSASNLFDHRIETINPNEIPENPMDLFKSE